MRRLVLLLVAFPIAAWLLLFVLGETTMRSASNRQWPFGLGTVASVPLHYPERTLATPTAADVVRLATAFGVDVAPRDESRLTSAQRTSFVALKPALAKYLDGHWERSSDAIDDPPPALADFLTRHRLEIDAVRGRLLTSGARVEWPLQLSKRYDAPIPNLLGHMELSRLFAASALLKARSGDAGGWEDLHALLLLHRGLRSRPEIISQLVALTIARIINVTAAKMPPPEPLWLAELRVLDHRRALAAALQGDAWLWTGPPPSEEKGLAAVLTHVIRPYQRMCTADSIDRMRVAVAEIARSSACDVGTYAFSDEWRRSLPEWNVFGRIAIPNISSSWRRVTRFTAELERTEKVLRLREGQAPSADSRCSDGKWIVTPASLKFSREVRLDRGGNYPLRYP